MASNDVFLCDGMTLVAKDDHIKLRRLRNEAVTGLDWRRIDLSSRSLFRAALRLNLR